MPRLLSEFLLCFPLAHLDARKRLLDYPLNYLVFHLSPRPCQERTYLVNKHVSHTTRFLQVARTLHQRFLRDFPPGCIISHQGKKCLSRHTCPCKAHPLPRTGESTHFVERHSFYFLGQRLHHRLPGFLN